MPLKSWGIPLIYTCWSLDAKPDVITHDLVMISSLRHSDVIMMSLTSS